MGFFRWLMRLFGFGQAREAGPPARGGYVIDLDLNVAEPPRPSGARRLALAEVLARARALSARRAQWPDIWADLNPGDDPTVRQLLVDLRNDGLQFAPGDGLRRIELACEELTGKTGADIRTVLRKVLGKGDVLDSFQ
jgi:hypothetical protein